MVLLLGWSPGHQGSYRDLQGSGCAFPRPRSRGLLPSFYPSFLLWGRLVPWSAPQEGSRHGHPWGEIEAGARRGEEQPWPWPCSSGPAEEETAAVIHLRAKSPNQYPSPPFFLHLFPSCSLVAHSELGSLPPAELISSSYFCALKFGGGGGGGGVGDPERCLNWI